MNSFLLAEDAKGGPIAVLLHGILSSSKSDPIKSLAGSLSLEGISTLRIDLPGHGLSFGRMEDMTPSLCLDAVSCALEGFISEYAPSRIFFAGHSLGAVLLGMLAHRYNPSAVVLLAPSASMDEDARKGAFMSYSFDPENIPERLQIGHHFLGRSYFEECARLAFREKAALYKGDVLVLHGVKDPIVPLSYARDYAGCFPSSLFEAVQDEDHSCIRNPRTLSQATGFIAEHNKETN